MGNFINSITSIYGKIICFIKHRLQACSDHKLLIVITTAGFISSILTFPLLNNYLYNFGKNLAGVFIPPLLTVLYLTCISFRHLLSRRHLLQAACSYILQILPFAPLFFQVFQPTGGDDFSRYYGYAKNMADNHTLWGGDNLFFAGAGNHYVTQPGYRYFIYLELLAFGKLYRFVQFLNIGLYLLAVYCLQKTIRQAVHDKLVWRMLLILVLLFTPYAIKNLLMGLPEWFTMALLIFACYCYIVPGHKIAAVFLLGLVPFFRQNLLVAVVLLFISLVWHIKKKVVLVLVFLIILLLPVYHNLYYAGKWRFFVDVFELPFIKSVDNKSVVNLELVVNNLLHYIGFDITNGHVVFSFIAGLFLPLAVVVYCLMVRSLQVVSAKLLFIAVTMSAVIPVVLLGTAYYPRFEFVNVGVFIATYLLLSTCLFYPENDTGFRYDF